MLCVFYLLSAVFNSFCTTKKYYQCTGGKQNILVWPICTSPSLSVMKAFLICFFNSHFHLYLWCAFIVLSIMWCWVCMNDSCVTLECVNERWGLCILALTICGCWEKLSSSWKARPTYSIIRDLDEAKQVVLDSMVKIWVKTSSLLHFNPSSCFTLPVIHVFVCLWLYVFLKCMLCSLSDIFCNISLIGWKYVTAVPCLMFSVHCHRWLNSCVTALFSELWVSQLGPHGLCVVTVWLTSVTTLNVTGWCIT